jgi:ParB family chromosome partitioning protein
MDPGSLEELAAIKSQGVMQPILVRPIGGAFDAKRYEIIAGERRWRAAQLAGLTRCPAWCARSRRGRAGHVPDREHPARRPQPLEEAGGIQRLIDEFGMTHQQAADAVGRSRPAASNLLRLLQLAPRCRSC